MPAQNKESRAASRQRSDHAQENAQDYVELIAEVQRELGAAHKSDLAARLGVSHVTVHKTIKRLKALGLVNAESYRAVTLTAKGERMAQEARARHELLLRFLEHLGVPHDDAVLDAEGLEHHCSPVTLQCIEKFCDHLEKKGAFKRPAARRAGNTRPD